MIKYFSSVMEKKKIARKHAAIRIRTILRANEDIEKKKTEKHGEKKLKKKLLVLTDLLFDGIDTENIKHEEQ